MGTIPSTTVSAKSANARPTSAPTPVYRHLFRTLKWATSSAVVLLGVVSAVYGVWGPLWPMEPAFSAGLPSSGSPFDVAFKVENRSVLFPLSNLTIACEVRYLGGISGVQISNNTVSASGANRLGPRKTGLYVCPIRQKLVINGRDVADVAREAGIAFRTEYDRPMFGGRASSESEAFTLQSRTNPPQWMLGAPLR